MFFTQKKIYIFYKTFNAQSRWNVLSSTYRAIRILKMGGPAMALKRAKDSEIRKSKKT